jgi:hypothetical protein
VKILIRRIPIRIPSFFSLGGSSIDSIKKIFLYFFIQVVKVLIIILFLIMDKLDKFVSSEQYALEFDKVMKEKPFSVEEPWPSNATSDHALIKANIGHGIVIVSWNLLNSVYMKWQEKVTDNGPRLYDHPMVQKENRESRLVKQFKILQQELENGSVLCLQEVSESMLELLTQTNCEMRSYWTNSSKKSNFNVICHKITGYGFLDAPRMEVNDPDNHLEGSTNVIILRTQFYNISILNVHVDFGYNTLLRDAVLRYVNYTNSPLLVVGDFNASSRLPVMASIENITTIYNDSRFLFYMDKEHMDYTHLTTFKNAGGSLERMRERIDYFMLVTIN